MTDFAKLQYDDPKDAVRGLYHMLMSMTERFFEKAKNQELDDAFIESLREEYTVVKDTLKYNMLDIPIYTYGMMCAYCEKNVSPYIGDDWREVLEKEYAASLECKKIKESDEEKWSHVSDWCDEMTDAFYAFMGNACRSVFGTELLHESFIAKIKKVF